MKKKIIFIIALFFMFIGITNAEKCTVISGTGSNIGDEIACGTEHFYVIENDGTNIKMLAKYNLYVGANYDKITFDINKTYRRIKCNDSNCNSYSFPFDKYFFDGEELNDYSEWWQKIREKTNNYNLYDLSYVANAPISNGNIAFCDEEVYGEPYTIGDKTYFN